MAQVELAQDKTETDEHPGLGQRQRRRGLIRKDMHTVYDVPFQILGAVPTQELRAIAHSNGSRFSQELVSEAKAIIRVREDPQDRDAESTDL